MARLLITGGAGYIGSHTVWAALDAGHEVAVVDNLSTGIRANLPENVPFHLGDVGDGTFMDAVLRQVRPDGVIHFAGSIVVPESVVDPGKYYRNNTMATLSLVESCLRNDVRRLIFSSTAAVYGLPEDGVAREDTPTRPINPYGWSKLMIEQVLADMANAHGLVYAALRYFNVAGADPAGRTGQSTPQATHLIKVACEVAIGKRSGMAIFGTDYPTRDGSGIRDYIHVSDLAEAHLRVFDHMVENGRNLCLNCGNGRGYSVREVVAALEGLMGHPIACEEGPRRAGDPPMLVTDPARMFSELGWRPQRTAIEEMISSALAWERKLSDGR